MGGSTITSKMKNDIASRMKNSKEFKQVITSFTSHSFKSATADSLK